ncbi:TIM barrel protein [Paenibacillus xerothermodurans]|uniref:TIM barrel protein n=1 Tax=Paenibacillus xerothermodurans TaxID=1977292 RepID=UPI0014038EF8
MGEMGQFVRAHGIRAAVEPHPGFVVCNSETALKLCEVAGGSAGVNFDPSHLFWQGSDPVACILPLNKRYMIRPCGA